MKKLTLNIIIILAFFNSTALAVHLKWEFKDGERLYIEKFTDQEILNNGELVRKRAIRDLVVVQTIGDYDGMYPLGGIYRSYEQDSLDPDSTFALTEEEELQYSISNNGIYQVPENKLLPTIRDIPYFPQEDIQPGDRWENIGYEIFPFNPPIKISIPVIYQFLGFEKKEGVNCAKILFNYNINQHANHSRLDAPVRFGGYSYSTLWYDHEKNRPVYVENDYDILMIYSDNSVIQYRGALTGWYDHDQVYTDKDKKKLQREVERYIGKDDDITVRPDDKGVIISIGEIFFDYDSTEIRQDHNKALDRIGQVLKDNPRYEIIVEGHTDDIGSNEYNQRLSEQRARNTLDFFIRQGYIRTERGAYRGMGKSAPLFPNTSEENRQANRRVEIIIKQE